MQQQPQVDENTARQQQLWYDNDGVLEIYNMLQDVECPEKPNVDEHVTDDTQKKAMEDPAHTEEDGKCRNTYLGKRLREASTKKTRKRCTPDKKKDTSRSPRSK